MKRKPALPVVFILAFFIASFSVHAQDIEQTLAKYADKFQPEKVYLHYDKATYLPGETIWFKAYLMTDIFPTEDSKTLYTDWIDDNGNVLTHNVSPVVDGVSSGQLQIPAEFTSKYLHVRAYTKWMLNFDTAFLYKKDIRVLGKEVAKGAAKVVPQYYLQFFPEGGDAIAGVANKIAFKANDQWGRPFYIKGTIYANDKPVQEFSSLHDGMGFINLTPSLNITYTAKWKDEKGVEHSTNLPASKTSGVSLQIVFRDNKRGFIISRSQDVSPTLQSLHILGNMHGHEVFKATISLANKTLVQSIIPTEQMPSGILTVTLFDAAWNAIAERIVFINNNDFSFQPTVSVQHWGLNKRARNEIEIKVPDSIQANLSVAITDAAIDTDSSNNIISHFLLSSELRGYVHKPAFYFQNNSDSLAQFLDLVMLTNGWRRFKWDEIAAGKLPNILYAKDTAYLYLSGKVYGIPSNRLGPADNIILLTKERDSIPKMMMMPIQNDGTFGDPNLILFDSLRVYYQLKSKLAEKGDVKFMPALVTTPNYSALSKSFQFSNLLLDTAGNYRHRLLAEEQARALALLQGKTLSMVTVTSKTKSPLQQLDEKYTRGLFAGGDAVQFDVMNDISALGRTDIFSYLQGRVAGLTISQNGSNVSMQWRGGTPQLFLDEMPVESDLISSISVSDIAYVKVFRPPFFGASGGGNGGAIAIYTRKGGDIQNQPGKGLSKNTVYGYSAIRQFYSPNYDSYDKRNEQPDMRSTLYWNPIIITNAKKHNATVVFYNNDVTKSFRLIIEGMTKEGLLTHYEEILE